jgi:hypothetical protein
MQNQMTQQFGILNQHTHEHIQKLLELLEQVLIGMVIQFGMQVI